MIVLASETTILLHVFHLGFTLIKKLVNILSQMSNGGDAGMSHHEREAE